MLRKHFDGILRHNKHGNVGNVVMVIMQEAAFMVAWKSKESHGNFQAEKKNTNKKKPLKFMQNYSPPWNNLE